MLKLVPGSREDSLNSKEMELTEKLLMPYFLELETENLEFINNDDADIIKEFISKRPRINPNFAKLLLITRDSFNEKKRHVTEENLTLFTLAHRNALMASVNVHKSGNEKNIKEITWYVRGLIDIYKKIEETIEPGEEFREYFKYTTTLLNCTELILLCNENRKKETRIINIIRKYVDSGNLHKIYTFLRFGAIITEDSKTGHIRRCIDTPGVVELFNSDKFYNLDPDEQENFLMNLIDLTDKEVSDECKAFIKGKQSSESMHRTKETHTHEELEPWEKTWVTTEDLDCARSLMGGIKKESIRKKAKELLCNKKILENPNVALLQEEIVCSSATMKNPSSIKIARYYITNEITLKNGKRVLLVDCEGGEFGIIKLLRDVQNLPFVKDGAKVCVKKVAEESMKKFIVSRPKLKVRQKSKKIKI